MGRLRRSTAGAPARRGIPPLRRSLRRREGGGSPSPACSYGRIGWGSRRWCPGGDGAGGGRFGGGVVFSGGGALRSSSSPRASCESSGPGGVLECLGSPSDLRWRRIRWLELGAGRGRRIRPASGWRSSSARWRCRRGRVLAVVVHRFSFRRRAADDPCGVFLRRRCSQAAVRWWSMVFVLGAGGDGVLRSGSVSLAYCTFVSLCVLCTMYMVSC